MALATKRPTPPAHPTRKLWKAPMSRANWLWLGASILLYGGVYLWYLYGLRTQQYPSPNTDPFRLFGIIAFVLVLCVAAYTLRRRFIRVLPGKVQGWLWLHIWFGVISILIAFLHENYSNVLHDYYFAPSILTDSAAGMPALFSLLSLVLSGIFGRLLDIWQARVIAGEASRNGVGIAEAVEQRIHELDLVIERFKAGKSAQFKDYCSQAVQGKAPVNSSIASLLSPQEREDFVRVCALFPKRAALLRSLQRQVRARRIIQGWRYVHVPLAIVAVLVIGLHSCFELLKMLLQALGRS